jgi:DNA repair photolyase
MSPSDVTTARVRSVAVARGLKKNRMSEPFFCARYSFSPYQGCGHGCLYCDGRAEKYYVDGEFDRDIVARTNLPALLEQELDAIREPAFLSIGSGVSDVYQPVEETLRLTRACAEVVARKRIPVVLATKSTLVRRDLDIWGRVARETAFILLMTIVTVDDGLRTAIEPGASPTDDRLETLRVFKEAGCGTGVLAMPLLPGLSDAPTDVEELIDAVTAVGVDCVAPGNLTLRPGRQKDLFMDYIRRAHPHLEREYRRLYAEDRQSGNTIHQYRSTLYPRLEHALLDRGIPGELPHRLWKGHVNQADEIHLLLCHMAGLYRRQGVAVARLTESIDRYRRWLDEKRRYFNRRRSLPAGWVDDALANVAAEPGGLAGLLGNDRLADFVAQVLDGKTLDYRTLALT